MAQLAAVARSRLLWLIVLPLAAAAWLAGHAIGYRLAQAGPQDVALHGYLRYAPLALTAAFSLLFLAFGLRIAGRLPGRPQAWPYALLPPLAYSFQELAERLAAGVGPEALLHAPVVAGLAVQLPLAALAYALARALLRCADTVGRLLQSPPRAPRPAALLPVPASAPTPRPRPSAHAGFGRAPPR